MPVIQGDECRDGQEGLRRAKSPVGIAIPSKFLAWWRCRAQQTHCYVVEILMRKSANCFSGRLTD